MSQQVLVERFLEALISGDRAASRAVVDECIDADVQAERIIERLFWPTLQQIETLSRNDQITMMAHHLATRLLRLLADQMQLRLSPAEANGRSVLVLCGPDEPNELAGQMAADLLDARGFEVAFAGGGVANDEIIAEIGKRDPETLILYSSAPSDLPHIRQLIDELHDLGVCPQLQIVVGGGVFNRADGLAEEIGADLWASSPAELVEAIEARPDQRMDKDQRTVGRRRRQGNTAAA